MPQPNVPKVLVFVPLFPDPPYIYDQTLDSILRQGWPGFHLALGHEPGQIATREDKYLNVTKKYNQAREMCLQGEYDYLWTVEADMIVPPDALSLLWQSLAGCGADVAYGLYASRHKDHFLCFATRLGEISIQFAHKSPQFLQENWGKVMPSAGLGLGCTLIRRRVLEEISFRYEGDLRACDWLFALDCADHGFHQVHHLGVICGHISMTPSTRIIWPQKPDDTGRWYGVEYLDIGGGDGIRDDR